MQFPAKINEPTGVGPWLPGYTRDVEREIERAATFIRSLESAAVGVDDAQTLSNKTLETLVVVTHTPSSASDTGAAGQIAWDADYIYVCTATDTWKRVAISTW